jgi:NADH dehydrogenase
MSTHTIAVTGSSGFVGRSMVRELLGRNHAVRALVRDPAKARRVFGTSLPANLTLVTGDVCDPSALDDLLRGATAAVHLVGIIREVRGESSQRPQTFHRMHVQATRAVVDACQRAGVRRLLHMSALGVSPEGRSDYQKTKWEAETIVRRSGLDWTVFRPGLIHGPDGELIQMLGKMASGEVAPFIFMPYFAKSRVDHSVLMGAVTYEPALVQPVAVQDVAFAFAQALDAPDSVGEVYPLVGPERLNWQELCEAVRDALPGASKRMPVWYIPGEHAALLADAASRVGLGSLLPFDKGQALMATEDSVADPAKAAIDLGFSPRPFRPALRSYASAV